MHQYLVAIVILLALFVFAGCGVDPAQGTLPQDAGHRDTGGTHAPDTRAEPDISSTPDGGTDACTGDTDCFEHGSGCDSGRCPDSACSDGVQNGHETDVDCGGPDCSACAASSGCSVDADCLSGLCEGGTCAEDQPAECTGAETRSCYEGPAGTQGVGACSAGQQQCDDGSWGACQGAVIPVEEVANDGVDNDCDGDVDEDPFVARAVTGGHWHACGVDATGRAYCWGSNRNWQLGDTTQQDRDRPTPVSTSLTFDSVVAGYFFNCGLFDGQAYCWGHNEKGQLGTGDTSDRSTPTAVNTSVQFVALAAGRSHACGITDSGEAYCWGANNNGQIGTGDTYPTQLTPQKVAGTGKYVELTAGQLHTCGLSMSGNVYCWGYGGHGQIGDGGTEPYRTSPAQVAGGRTYTALTSGYRHNCAIASDGETYCWGRNPSGQLGDGTTTDRGVPVKVDSAVQFEDVFAGFFHTCALGVDSKTYCWGQNNDGQVGDGTTTDRHTPVEVDTLANFVEVATMVDGNCARTDQDEIYCWGRNSYGQLGAVSGQSLGPVPLQ